MIRRRCLALLFIALVLFAFACGDTILPVKGQLMLVVTTNLAPPKDFDTIHVRIQHENATTALHDVEYSLSGSQAIKLPATLGIVVGSNPDDAIHVLVEAKRAGATRITREAVARVPRDRIAALPLPVDGLCVDRACPPDASGNAQTCIAGLCQTPRLETDTLATFSDGDIWGEGHGPSDGACFDTLACFTNGKSAVVDRADCSVEVDTHSGFGFNVAVVRPPGSDGICGANACLLVIDRDPFPTSPIISGWREQGGRAVLPSVVCEQSLPVLVTTSCATKNAPTCGPWSVTGTERDLGGPSIPFDAAALAIDAGDAGPIIAADTPRSIRFLDEDPRLGFVSGTVTIERAADESKLTSYELYWADGPTRKLGLIATLPKTGANVAHVLTGAVAPGATHFLAFSKTSAGEVTPGATLGPVDNYPAKTRISVSGVDMDRPSLLVDAKGQRLLVVGFDKSAAHQKPALVRCKLDGSDCTYADISAGGAAQGDAQTGAAIDAANDKLLVFVDNDNGGATRLLRCNVDGTGCVATTMSPKPFAQGLGCRVPVLVDTVNQKILIVGIAGTGGGTMLYRCAIDGTACTPTPIVNSSNTCPEALISPSDAKLLVVQRDPVNSRASLNRCNLDGTNCNEIDISAGRTTTPVRFATAIDTENQKLVVLAYFTNDLTLSYYRCNLDGTGCASHDLGARDEKLDYPTDPAIVFDTEHHRMFVFAYSAGASGGFFARCDLAGTACVNTRLTESDFGGRSPTALLHEGRLFTASPSFSVPGVNLFSLAAY